MSTDITAQIEEARSLQHTTRRATVPAMEDLLYEVLPVLDHGFVRVIDYMGDDAAVVQAARVSYGRGTKAASDDRGLLRYLMRHRHTSPFEMCEIKLHVKLPIFVARQWIRHRTSNVNEISARYSILDREFYIPDPENIAVQSATNNQGRGEVLTADQAAVVRKIMREEAERDYVVYETLHNDDGNKNPIDPTRPMVARELARSGLSVNYYTQWYWKTDLHNLLHFLGLRKDPHAQYEIRVYADVIGDIVSKWAPYTWEAFQDYRFGGAFLSRFETELVTELLHGQDRKSLGKALREKGASVREVRAFLDRFNVE